MTMTITITAFERSPDGGKVLARDMRLRLNAPSTHRTRRPANYS
jgi:hypothetical protein